jgi:hypothetical protein
LIQNLYFFAPSKSGKLCFQGKPSNIVNFGATSQRSFQGNFRSQSVFALPSSDFPIDVCTLWRLILNQAEPNLAEVTRGIKKAACRRAHQINLHQVYDEACVILRAHK